MPKTPVKRGKALAKRSPGKAPTENTISLKDLTALAKDPTKTPAPSAAYVEPTEENAARFSDKDTYYNDVIMKDAHYTVDTFYNGYETGAWATLARQALDAYMRKHYAYCFTSNAEECKWWQGPKYTLSPSLSPSFFTLVVFLPTKLCIWKRERERASRATD